MQDDARRTRESVPPVTDRRREVTPRRRPFAPSTTLHAGTKDRSSRERDVFDIGQVVADTYVIRELIGQGGMGQVYEAYDRTLARRVAIKASWPDVAPSVLQREAQALAAIRHPAAVTVYSSGLHEGTSFVVMERLQGVPLDEHLTRLQRLSPIAATEILLGLADALVAVHEAGIVHRDIKPPNIMMLPRHRLVLMDFGLFGTDGAAAGVLDVCGTPAYMAPETARGDVQPRDEYLVDLYAMGVVAFELLTGELPFQGDSAQATMRLHVNSQAPRLRERRADVPTSLDELVHDLLQKSPDARPHSASVVVDRLRQIRAELAEQRFQVLVVDDDPAVARVLAHYAKSAADDVEVTVANDAPSALKMMTDSPPDLALIDLHMPQMSGLELVMYLGGAHLTNGCSMVVVSAGAMQGDVELLRALGISQVIKKDERLRGEVGACVRRARQRWQQL